MTFKEFAREHNLTITYSPTGKGRWSGSLEFHVLLYRGEKRVWSGPYTIGIGIVREASKTRPDLITVDMVLQSLQLDVQGVEQTFSDWANEFGHSDDSIEAHEIWEACNHSRRQLRKNLGYPLFDAFLEVGKDD